MFTAFNLSSVLSQTFWFSLKASCIMFYIISSVRIQHPSWKILSPFYLLPKKTLNPNTGLVSGCLAVASPSVKCTDIVRRLSLLIYGASYCAQTGLVYDTMKFTPLFWRLWFRPAFSIAPIAQNHRIGAFFLYINGFAIDAAYLCLLLLRTIWQVKNTGHVVINELCDSWWNLSWVCFFILPHGPITRDINNGPSISITSPCKAIWNLEWTDLVSARLIYRIKIRTPPGSASSIKSEPKGLTPVFNHQIPIWSALFLSLYNLSHHRLQGSHNRHDF